MKVLVVPCGTEIGLEIARSLKGVKNIELIGLNSLIDYSSTVYKEFYSDAPFIDEPEFLDYLKSFISKHSVTHVFPAHDSAALLLSENAECFGENVKVITSSAETNRICRSKKLTYDCLNNVVATPYIYNSIKDVENVNFPLFLKPDVGQGSKGARIIKEISELSHADFQENIITEYLPGNEYTVDCFTDHKGELLYAGPRIRSRVLNGISVSTSTIKDVDGLFLNFAKNISKKLSFKGMWFFQVKENNAGVLVLMEAATRIAGSMSTNRVRGVNFAELSLYVHNATSVELAINTFQVKQERALSNKYKLNIEYKHVYVDFDDCLIIDDKVNEELVAFLYKAINNNCSIYLVTRHEYNLSVSLKKYRLTGLFDEIFHITDKSPKSAIMTHTDAIFIDDSFREREDVISKGIPSFSVDCVEALL
ncbi:MULTISPECIES: ATP-grasp domain-containing protein [unclassified Colwellia]|uniref:ATP-grasp domain-containing protein n=1 Tax=unclassified Colwellia TaxID=196834 RepID=UPI0015F7191E|nr:MULTISPECIES: ATP-grasp domain-containing protein [unclassified Colwellia]MBA6358063.1 ATP-grasp domain-containing protein [Colwellia sp. BRX8-3]MBA6361963.1 ATP-grasp domain-containing protein [Colwellia sp. BRX8-6]MBA6368664.1 ATP-grasp domain-containing protein [Colwellia sp. BRX8-5]MBA6377166.1 ATP-grasp domain-containing protein [Colwellia sp. BRX8-2]